MIEPIVKRIAGLDVHKMVVVGTVLIEEEDGSIKQETREFGTFKRDRRQMCQWLKNHGVELVAMESTGIYWKSIYATLERSEILTYVVNARHVKNVPGRKTDVSDSQWLAALVRVGLLKPSFIPTKDFRELRIISRQRMKINQTLSAEKNRLNKVLDDAGIRLGGVASDIDGVSAQKIIEGIIDGKPIEELIACVRGRLKAKTDDLRACLDEELSERHIFLLKTLQEHIQFLKSKLEAIDAYLFAAMSPYQKQWEILQTLPGVDKVAARRTKSQFKGKYESLVIRRGHKRTIIALGHKILRVIFVMLKNVKPYLDPGIDYEELMVDRNAPRWLQALKKFGYLPQTV